MAVSGGMPPVTSSSYYKINGYGYYSLYSISDCKSYNLVCTYPQDTEIENDLIEYLVCFLDVSLKLYPGVSLFLHLCSSNHQNLNSP